MLYHFVFSYYLCLAMAVKLVRKEFGTTEPIIHFKKSPDGTQSCKLDVTDDGSSMVLYYTRNVTYRFHNFAVGIILLNGKDQ